MGDRHDHECIDWRCADCRGREEAKVVAKGVAAERARIVQEEAKAKARRTALRDALTWMGQTNDGDTEERRRILAAGWAALEGR